MRHRAPTGTPSGPPVLILHGATFPSANAAAWKIDGRSWMDELAAAGYDVYALDFLGFGESDRYPEMASDDPRGAALGDIDMMTGQVHRAVEQIARIHGGSRVNLIAHSAGTLVAGRYAELHGERVARLVLFGPPAPSPGGRDDEHTAVRYFQMSANDQLESFEPKVRQAGRLSMSMFEEWAQAYLATDSESGHRDPASVRVPAGMRAALREISRGGQLSYDPGRITAPALVIVGEWDAVTPPSQVLWVFEHLASPLKRFVVLSQGGHRLHLERSRFQLFREVEGFLEGGDDPPGH